MTCQYTIPPESSRPVECFGRIYPLGYTAPGAAQRLETLMQDPHMVLVDIRYSARSRWMPQWNKQQLQAQWGPRYLHIWHLGNANYRQKELPIRIVNLEEGLTVLIPLLLRKQSCVLLCACKTYEQCHRKTIAGLLIQRIPQAEIILEDTAS